MWWYRWQPSTDWCCERLGNAIRWHRGRPSTVYKTYQQHTGFREEGGVGQTVYKTYQQHTGFREEGGVGQTPEDHHEGFSRHTPAFIPELDLDIVLCILWFVFLVFIFLWLTGTGASLQKFSQGWRLCSGWFASHAWTRSLLRRLHDQATRP